VKALQNWFGLIGALLLLVAFVVGWEVHWSWPTRGNQLFVAVWNNDTNEVGLLLARGMSPNIRSTMLSHATPLIDAVRFQDAGIVRLLLTKGADPNIADWHGHAALYQALTSPYLGNSGPNDSASLEIVTLLLTHGADPGATGVADILKGFPPNDQRAQMCREYSTNRPRAVP
jgi:hypothetical protein